MLTVASILATTAMFSLAMLLVLGSLLRMQVPGVRDWFCANLSMLVSLPLLILRDTIPDWISIVLANTLLGMAGTFYYSGCARFLGLRVHWPRLLAGVAALAAAMSIWRYLHDNPAARVVASTAFSGLMCILCAQLLLRHRPRERNPFNFYFGAGLALVFAAAQFIRGGYFLIAHPAGSPMSNSLWNVGLLTVGAVVMPTLTMVAVMLVHDTMLARVEDAVNHDHLTAALSRKRFESLAQALLSRAAPTRPFALLLIDLDHFKRINDTWGHAAGDEVLRAFAQLARNQARPQDALGRLGGEEFGLLLPDTSQAEALIVAERLRSLVEQTPVQGSFGTCPYTLSIGVACTIRVESFDRLSARADQAMYIAKNSGRNRVSVAAMELPASSGAALADGTAAKHG